MNHTLKRKAIIDRVLGPGEELVFPGHPLVLAVFVMKYFPSFEMAVDPKGAQQYLAALVSPIPGAGGQIHEALQFLEYIKKGVLTSDEVVIAANKAWAACDGIKVKNPKKFKAGQDQANKLEPEFLELVRTWISAPTPSWLALNFKVCTAVGVIELSDSQTIGKFEVRADYQRALEAFLLAVEVYPAEKIQWNPNSSSVELSEEEFTSVLAGIPALRELREKKK